MNVDNVKSDNITPTRAASFMYQIVVRFRHSAVWQWIIALFPVLFVCLVHTPKYGMFDDYGSQSLLATGHYYDTAQSSRLMLYTLAPVSIPLSLLYQIMPSIAWYPLLLLVLIVIFGKTMISYAMHYLRSMTAMISIVVITLGIEYSSTIYLTYTIVAFLAAGAGLMYLMKHAYLQPSQRIHVADISGLLLIIIGYSLRPESGTATIAVFAPIALYVFFIQRKSAGIVRGVVALILVGICKVSGDIAYHAFGWDSYLKYLNPGRVITDSIHLDFANTKVAVPNMPESTYRMLYSMLFAERNTFTSELFERVAAQVPRYSIHNLLIDSKSTYLSCALLLVFLVLFSYAMWRKEQVQRTDIYLITFVIGIFTMLIAVLLLRIRAQFHVVTPLFFVALSAVIVCIAHSTGNGTNIVSSDIARSSLHKRVISLCLIATLLFSSFTTWMVVKYEAWLNDSSSTASSMIQYARTHSKQTFLFTIDPWFFNQNIFEFNSFSFPDNIIEQKGWMVYTAVWEQAAERNGIDPEHTYVDLINNPKYRLIADKSTADLFADYLSDQTNKSVRAVIDGQIQNNAQIDSYKFIAK